MGIVASITPEPNPWTIGQQGIYLVRLRDKALNTPVDLNSGTLTGKFGSVALTGALVLVDARGGVFTWAAAVADSPATAGRYGLQFKATGTPGGTVENDPYPMDVKAPL